MHEVTVPVRVNGEVRNFPAERRSLDLFRGVNPEPEAQIDTLRPVSSPHWDFFQAATGEWIGVSLSS